MPVGSYGPLVVLSVGWTLRFLAEFGQVELAGLQRWRPELVIDADVENRLRVWFAFGTAAYVLGVAGTAAVLAHTLWRTRRRRLPTGVDAVFD